ncbi:MAG: glycosyltransferase family 9 protein, partial [Candidatus Omnitrophica bacterium]|nr:glycosyltransferase family 9 protein [Candidatus Omnitrophota bacterium]
MPRFHNILIVRTDRIGDVILTTPAIKAIRKAYPMAHISILVTPATKDLVEGSPYLNEVLVDDRLGSHKGVLGILHLARDIRRRNFDAVFIFHTKRRYNLACFLAGIPTRIGYKNNKFGMLLTHPVKDVRPLGEKHEAQYCLDILQKVGIQSSDLDFYIPINKEADVWATQWLSSNGVNEGEIIAIHAGSSDPAKCWSTENFAQLINSLEHRYHFKMVLIGSPDTRERSGQILHLSRSKPLDLTGQTSLAQTTSLLRRCRVLISNDSGPVHIGSAVGIYVVS